MATTDLCVWMSFDKTSGFQGLTKIRILGHPSCKLHFSSSCLKLFWISIYNRSEWCFSRDLIGSSILGYQVLFTSWRFPEKKMAREPHFVVKYSSYLGTAIKLVLYILKQLFASVSVNSGGYLPCRSGAVNIHRYSTPLRNNCELAQSSANSQRTQEKSSNTLSCQASDW